MSGRDAILARIRAATGGARGDAPIVMATGLQYVLVLRLRRRALAYALSDPECWQRLWNMGGLTLRLPQREETLVDSPDGDWTDFAARHLGRRQ